MRVVLAGGGTGGHVYPSLAVARALEDELHARGETVELLYVGVRGRIDETIVPRAGIPFRAVQAGPLRVPSRLAFARNVIRLKIGALQSLRMLRGFRPDAVFATGGYASVPVGVATRLLRRPLIVYLPDVTPGWAVRLLARLATRIAATSERALAYLPRTKTLVVGYPVRPEFWSTDRDQARASLGLPQEARVLLVTGASLGARAINEALFEALPRLLEGWHVLHLTGAADEARASSRREALPEPLRSRYDVRGYLDDMASAMHAADLVVGRAGASTLGELPAAGVPAVLVPGEYEGWSQAPNAAFLESSGAAVMLRNDELHRLADVIESLDDSRRTSMAAAARSLRRPEAARDLARMVVEAAV